jgi:hypothetical protein
MIEIKCTLGPTVSKQGKEILEFRNLGFFHLHFLPSSINVSMNAKMACILRQEIISALGLVAKFCMEKSLVKCSATIHAFISICSLFINRCQYLVYLPSSLPSP